MLQVLIFDWFRVRFRLAKTSSPGRTRTYDKAINSQACGNQYSVKHWLNDTFHVALVAIGCSQFVEFYSVVVEVW